MGRPGRSHLGRAELISFPVRRKRQVAARRRPTTSGKLRPSAGWGRVASSQSIGWEHQQNDRGRRLDGSGRP